MRAIILAGGKGTRLQPYTTLIPKPLVPLGGKYSILEIIIMQLAVNGYKHITLAVNHLSHLIMAYFGDGSRFNIKIDYSIEEIELSTIGPLTLIKDLPEHFLVMNGDILCDLDYNLFLREHIKYQRNISVASFNREVNIDFGVLRSNKESKLIDFEEKPTLYYQVSMGIYCFSRSILQQIPIGMKYGFDDLMRDSLTNNIKVQVYPFNGYWLDIGRQEDYDYANKNFESLSLKLGITE